MRPYILALDPGKTTGWAIYRSVPEHNYGPDDPQFECGELDFMGICRELDSWTSHYSDQLDVVSEEFKINARTAKNTQQTWSLEVMGVARYFSREFTSQDLIISQRSAAMNFSTDGRLKAIGWYVPGRPHGRAATRHLLHHLVARGWWDDRLGVIGEETKS